MVSCFKKSENHQTPSKQSQNQGVKFAKRFNLTIEANVTTVTVDRPSQNNKRSLKYILTSDLKTNYAQDGNVFTWHLNQPIKRIICTSTTHLPYLEILGVDSSLVGFPQTKFVYSPKLRSRIENGSVAEVGQDADLNIEKILALNPDIVMAFSSGSESRQLIKLRELGITVVMNADYLETTVLGRAEWIKFIAAFFNKSREAHEYFDQLVIRYNSLKQMTDTINRPGVMTGIVYGGNWFLAGGKNHIAGLIHDAGGKYLWADDQEEGWLNLDFEAVYSRAANADIWIGAADFKTLNELARADARYRDFKAYQNGQVFAYNARVNQYGANDYFESGVAKPDLLLKDHIKMIHPELLPDCQLYYYRQLE